MCLLLWEGFLTACRFSCFFALFLSGCILHGLDFYLFRSFFLSTSNLYMFAPSCCVMLASSFRSSILGFCCTGTVTSPKAGLTGTRILTSQTYHLAYYIIPLHACPSRNPLFFRQPPCPAIHPNRVIKGFVVTAIFYLRDLPPILASSLVVVRRSPISNNPSNQILPSDALTSRHDSFRSALVPSLCRATTTRPWPSVVGYDHPSICD